MMSARAHEVSSSGRRLMSEPAAEGCRVGTRRSVEGSQHHCGHLLILEVGIGEAEVDVVDRDLGVSAD